MIGSDTMQLACTVYCLSVTTSCQCSWCSLTCDTGMYVVQSQRWS